MTNEATKDEKGKGDLTDNSVNDYTRQSQQDGKLLVLLNKSNNNNRLTVEEGEQQVECEDSSTWSMQITGTWLTTLDCSFFHDNRQYCKQYEQAQLHCTKVRCTLRACVR